MRSSRRSPQLHSRDLADWLIRSAPVVFDVIYHPVDTPLMMAAEAAGRTAIGGFALLLHQAARQVELMTGAVQAPVEVMREAGIDALRTG